MRRSWGINAGGPAQTIRAEHDRAALYMHKTASVLLVIGLL